MAPDPAVTLYDVLRAVERTEARLEHGDQRFEVIDQHLDELRDVREASQVLVNVADTYRLAGKGGRILKVVLGFLAALAAIWTGVTEIWGGK